MNDTNRVESLIAAAKNAGKIARQTHGDRANRVAECPAAVLRYAASFKCGASIAVARAWFVGWCEA